jgi:acetyl-CoA acetyltransferase
MARLVSYAVACVLNEIMGEGPIPASKRCSSASERRY